MIVIDMDSRFTFNVDHVRRVSCTITKRAVYQEDYIAEGANHQDASNGQENVIYLAFNHIPCYTNNIPNNNHKSQQNIHKIQHKQGRVWASLFSWDGCVQSRYWPLNPSPTVTQSSNNFKHDHYMTLSHHSPNFIVAWNAQVQTPHQGT